MGKKKKKEEEFDNFLDEMVLVGYTEDGKSLFVPLKRCIEDEDWENVFGWAMDHYPAKDRKTAERVMECFRLCMEQGNTDAALNLGTFYYNGRFVKRDYKKAYELYKIAADASSDRGLCNCGYCCYYGRNGEPDYEMAYRYFSMGASLHQDANCLYKLGDMFLNGYYVEKNENLAIGLYRKALDKCLQQEDDSFCIGDIFARMGKCLLKGIGGEQDVIEAYRFLSMAQVEFYRRIDEDTKAVDLIEANRKHLKTVEKMLKETSAFEM